MDTGINQQGDQMRWLHMIQSLYALNKAILIKTPSLVKILEHRESNPGRQSDSLECYPYTMPDVVL